MLSHYFVFRFRTLGCFLICFLLVACTFGQKKITATQSTQQSIRSTPAYAEVLVRRTELTSELEALLVDHTEDFPKVVDLRLELSILKEENDRLLAVKPTDTGKLSLGLGKLILGKVEHAVALKRLQASLQDNHPNVIREKRQVEIFETAIKEILN